MAAGAARPVLSPAWRAPRTGQAAVWFSILVHVVILASFVLLISLRPPHAPHDAPAPRAEVEYFDLDFPGSGAPVGIPAPSAASAAAPTAAPGAGEVIGRSRRDEAERLVFPRARSGAPGGGAPIGGGAEPGGVAGGAGAAGAGQGGSGAGISERLKPGYRDTRLYVDQDIERLKETDTRSDIARYRERLQAAIESSNDSAWAQGLHPNTDWTRRDSEGRKWGVDEKGVHLGGITIPRALIPTPRSSGTNATVEAARQKEKDHQAIQEQEAERERRRVQAEAIRETRARKDAERAKKAEEGGS